MKILRRDITLTIAFASSQLALAGAGASGEAMAEAAEEGGGGILGAILVFGTIWVVGTIWQKISDANEETKHKRDEALRKRAYTIEKKINSTLLTIREAELKEHLNFDIPFIYQFHVERNLISTTQRMKLIKENRGWLVSAVNGYMDAEASRDKLKPEFANTKSKISYPEFGFKTLTDDWGKLKILLDGYEFGKIAYQGHR